MTLRPIGDYVIIERIEAPRDLALVHAPFAAQNVPVYGRVVAVGPGSVSAYGAVPMPPPPFAPGDLIILHAGCGVDVRHHGTTYTFILPTNVLAVVDA